MGGGKARYLFYSSVAATCDEGNVAAGDAEIVQFPIGKAVQFVAGVAILAPVVE